jgi:hypothetical protein
MKTPLKTFLPALWSCLLLWSPAAAETAFSNRDYAAVLDEYVDEKGLVDYAGLKNSRLRLDRWVEALNRLDRDSYESWNREEQLAFWINAYNGLTLRLIVDNYPIKSSRLKSVVFPKNSIRQISGAWTKKQFLVMGVALTLDAIEHDVLRAGFDEPRIHMALVCAALSCPVLRNEPYAAGALESQLEDQTRRFLVEETKFRIDRERGTVWLSAIFDWFGGDFVARYGTGDPPGKRSEQTKAVLNFVARHVGETDRKFIDAGEFRVRYIDYNWELNEKP